MSSKDFAINICKSSIKITMEPPKGLKLNLLRQYNNLKDQDFEACTKPELFKSFLFTLCFFHAIVQDRRKFGAIGWNNLYNFTNEDLIVSRMQLKTFLEDYEEIPYKSLHYLFAWINYGGRVTDDKDQRLIRCVMKFFIDPAVLKFEEFKFSKSGIYYTPSPGHKSDYIEYIKTLPPITGPEIFGLHENAEITTAMNESSELLDSVLSIQPRETGGAGKSSEQIMKEIVCLIEEKTPKQFDYEEVFKEYKTDYNESMNTVLIQEVIRYNVLLGIMDKNIKNLQLALSGKIVMSSELETIATSLYNNQIPAVWVKFGFLSLKPLMSWLSDLIDRIKFLDDWFKNGTPKVFCIPSKFYLV